MMLENSCSNTLVPCACVCVRSHSRVCQCVCARAHMSACLIRTRDTRTRTHARAHARTHAHTAADSWARWALEWRFLPQRVRTDSGKNGDDTYDRSSTSLTVEDRSKPERDASHLGFEM